MWLLHNTNNIEAKCNVLMPYVNCVPYDLICFCYYYYYLFIISYSNINNINALAMSICKKIRRKKKFIWKFSRYVYFFYNKSLNILIIWYAPQQIWNGLPKKLKVFLQILVIIKIIVQIFLMNIYFFLHLWSMCSFEQITI